MYILIAVKEATYIHLRESQPQCLGMRVSFHTSHIHIREVEWCARLHQRTHNQDWEVYRGDKENSSRDCEGIWSFQKYRP